GLARMECTSRFAFWNTRLRAPELEFGSADREKPRSGGARLARGETGSGGRRQGPARRAAKACATIREAREAWCPRVSPAGRDPPRREGGPHASQHEGHVEARRSARLLRSIDARRLARRVARTPAFWRGRLRIRRAPAAALPGLPAGSRRAAGD